MFNPVFSEWSVWNKTTPIPHALINHSYLGSLFSGLVEGNRDIKPCQALRNLSIIKSSVCIHLHTVRSGASVRTAVLLQPSAWNMSLSKVASLVFLDLLGPYMDRILDI